MNPLKRLRTLRAGVALWAVLVMYLTASAVEMHPAWRLVLHLSLAALMLLTGLELYVSELIPRSGGVIRSPATLPRMHTPPAAAAEVHLHRTGDREPGLRGADGTALIPVQEPGQ